MTDLLTLLLTLFLYALGAYCAVIVFVVGGTVIGMWACGAFDLIRSIRRRA